MKNLEKLFEEAQTELKTMIVFHKAERTFRAAESHVIKDHQLTPTQFSVLETLYSKGDLRIQNLIDSILATSGNMTVVIRNMVRDGWIKRETDPETTANPSEKIKGLPLNSNHSISRVHDQLTTVASYEHVF